MRRRGSRNGTLQGSQAGPRTAGYGITEARGRHAGPRVVRRLRVRVAYQMGMTGISTKNFSKNFAALIPLPWGAMREFVFEVAITAVVRVRAETEADARQAVVYSSALGSPSADEIRLANQANFIEGKERTITEVDFSIVDNSVKLRNVDEGSSSAP